MSDTPSLLKVHPCSYCDFSSGTRGMDRCAPCDGAGSVFIVGDQKFPNSQEGYEKALEAKVTQLNNLLDQTIKAWEALPGGRNHKVADVQEWLVSDMKPMIDKLRKYLK